MALTTSVDAVAVGVNFAFLTVNIWLTSLAIGVVAFLATAAAIKLGNKIGVLVGRGTTAVGGMIVIAIGIRMLLEHIL